MESVSNNLVVTSVPLTVVPVESDEHRSSAGGLATDLSAVAQALPDPAPSRVPPSAFLSLCVGYRHANPE